MTLIAGIREAHGATFETHGGIEIMSHYGRLGRTHRAVRSGVGVIKHDYGVVVVEGEGRVDYIGNAVTDTVPDEDGKDVYALLLDPDDRIETEMYAYSAGERLLIFTPRDRAEPLVEEWGSKTFLQRVKVHDAPDKFGVPGVYGLQSTERVVSVLSGAGAPEPELSFVRDSIGGKLGVMIVASNNPTGEEGYDVIYRAKDTEDMLSTLLFYDSPSVPVGYRTWDSLTAETNTPLFESEPRDNVPSVAGIRNALNLDKSCFVGQELVSKIENRGRPSRRFVSFRTDVPPDSGAGVSADGELIGTVTRTVESPILDAPIDFALVDYGLNTGTLKVTVDGDRVEATRESLPFVEGGVVSTRLPTYPGEN